MAGQLTQLSRPASAAGPQPQAESRRGRPMSNVSISGLTRRFDGNPPTVAVANLDLEIEDGEFLVLLGPSGCGKTTTLRCLAGLETPSAGTIRQGGSVVFDKDAKVNLPPNKRSIGMVFQSYALWPHMTVRKNIAYPLKARKMREALASGPVERTAELVDCQDLLERYPAQLSGGQQQRVALARGLVASARSGPVRRAAEQPGRPVARPGAGRAPRAPPAHAVHRGLRDARPERGSGARHPDGDHARRHHRAARYAASGLREPCNGVRRCVHRHVQPHRRPLQRRLLEGRHVQPRRCIAQARCGRRRGGGPRSSR